MITGFSVRNFKNLASIPAADGLVPFGALNVLIGPNGCGKSSLLQAIDFLRAFFHSSIEVYLKDRGWDFDDIPNLRQAKKAIRWELTAQLPANGGGVGAGEFRYLITLQPRRHLGIGEESLSWTPPGDAPIPLLNRVGRKLALYNRHTNRLDEFKAIGLPASAMAQLEGAKDAKFYPELLRFREWVEGFRSYLIWDPKLLRNPDRGRHDELGPSGEHLAAVVGNLRDTNPKAFERLVRRVRGLFPTVTDIAVFGRGWGWRSIQLYEGKDRDAVEFNSQQMSDGVLRLLAITTLLYSSSLPTVLTLEEPENGVHPQLVREVVQILREITQRKSPHPCQVFFTTHSPYVLDDFLDHPEEVYCLDRAAPLAGATITRLSEQRQLRHVRREFKHSLGEAWTAGLIGAAAGVRRP